MYNNYNLFPNVDKIQISIERIKEFEPPEGYYVAFSGGKDSQVIYELTKMAGVRFDAHYNNTTVDPPELVYFIRKNYPDVTIHRPSRSMWQIIASNTIPPTARVRYCCKELKEYGGRGRLVMTGIRAQESSKRSKRQILEVCYKDNSKKFLNPIIDWSTEDVWNFIHERNLKYCPLYDKGYIRLGCIMCPCANLKKRITDIIRYPKYYQGYLRAFSKMLENRNYKGHETQWKTPEDVMIWWLTER